MLKREPAGERAWREFTQLAGQTTQRVQQTAVAALAPPRQRRKARYMNAAELVGWGARGLKDLEEDGGHRQEVDPQRVGKELGWVQNYRQEVEQWRQVVEVVTTSEQFVKEQGLSPDGAQRVQQQLAGVGTRPRTQQGCAELVRFVAEEAATAKDGERLVGSSEGIESMQAKRRAVFAPSGKAEQKQDQLKLAA